MPRPRAHSGRRQRRRVEWVISTLGDATSLTANTKVALRANLQASFENLGSPTLVRTRSHFVVAINSGTEFDDVLVGMGIAIVTALAAAAGAASLPGPLTNGDFPWLWHATRGGRFLEGQTAATDGALAGGVANLQLFDFPCDSKAMRKLNAEEELVVCIELENTAGTAAGQLQPFATRHLLMQ